MDAIFQIIAALAIFMGALIFGNGYDKRPRLDGYNEVYKRRLKLRMVMGVALACCGLAYFIRF